MMVLLYHNSGRKHRLLSDRNLVFRQSFDTAALPVLRFVKSALRVDLTFPGHFSKTKPAPQDRAPVRQFIQLNGFRGESDYLNGFSVGYGKLAG